MRSATRDLTGLDNGKPIAMRVVDNSTNKLYFLHGDHLGSTSLTTCGNAACGTVGAEYSRQFYLPYGSLRATSGSITPTDIGFTGQRLDATGLMFYSARYYDATLGRFISADTILPEAKNPQTLNRYSYSYNNPVKYTDPTGHCPFCISIALGAVGGAIIGAAIYTAVAGPNFNLGDLAISAGVGAVGGALVGTGFGFSAGLATFGGISAAIETAGVSSTLLGATATGAGVGALSSQVGYTASAGSNFNSGDMAVAAYYGGMTGAISGYTTEAYAVGSLTATGIRVAAGTVGSVAQYATTETIHGKNPTPSGLYKAGAIGAISSVGGELIGGYSFGQDSKDMAMRYFLQGLSDGTRNVLLYQYGELASEDQPEDLYPDYYPNDY